MSYKDSVWFRPNGQKNVPLVDPWTLAMERLGAQGYFPAGILNFKDEQQTQPVHLTAVVTPTELAFLYPVFRIKGKKMRWDGEIHEYIRIPRNRITSIKLEDRSVTRTASQAIIKRARTHSCSGCLLSGWTIGTIRPKYKTIQSVNTDYASSLVIEWVGDTNTTYQISLQFPDQMVAMETRNALTAAILPQYSPPSAQDPPPHAPPPSYDPTLYPPSQYPLPHDPMLGNGSGSMSAPSNHHHVWTPLVMDYKKMVKLARKYPVRTGIIIVVLLVLIGAAQMSVPSKVTVPSATTTTTTTTITTTTTTAPISPLAQAGRDYRTIASSLNLAESILMGQVQFMQFAGQPASELASVIPPYTSALNRGEIKLDALATAYPPAASALHTLAADLGILAGVLPRMALPQTVGNNSVAQLSQATSQVHNQANIVRSTLGLPPVSSGL